MNFYEDVKSWIQPVNENDEQSLGDKLKDSITQLTKTFKEIEKINENEKAEILDEFSGDEEEIVTFLKKVISFFK